MICLLCEDDLDDDIITELLAINFSLFVDLFDASFLTPRDKFVNESLRLVSDLNVTCCSHGCLYCATHVSLLWQQSYPICCFSPFGFIRAIIAPPCVNNNPFQPSLTFSSFFLSYFTAKLWLDFPFTSTRWQSQIKSVRYFRRAGVPFFLTIFQKICLLSLATLIFSLKIVSPSLFR